MNDRDPQNTQDATRVGSEKSGANNATKGGEQWIGVIKLLIGSVAATAITTIASCHLKSVEFNQKDRDLEREFLSQHFDYITNPKNKDNRILLAQYCATVFGGRWQDYKKELQDENKKTLENSSKTKSDLVEEKKQAKAAASPGESGAAEAKEAAIDVKLANLQQQIGDAQTARTIAGLAPVDKASVPVPQATIPPNNQVIGWCYAGKYTASGVWADATIQDLPKDGKVANGSTVVVATPLYLRTTPRTKESAIPGAQQGVIQQGATLKVIDSRSFEDTHSVWLNVEVKSPQLYVAAPSLAAN
jgi:hypothetical protein